jgi:hypothetical protein
MTTPSQTCGTGRGPAAERGGKASSLGRVAADELDDVAARDRPSGYGTGHAPYADETDTAHG